MSTMKKNLLLIALLFNLIAASQTATPVKNINPQDQGTGISAEKAYLGNDYVFPGEKKLWKTDGTPAGTVVIKDFNPSNIEGLSHLTTLGSVVMFTVSSTTNQLWKTDGTEAGTVMVKDFGTYTIMFHKAVVGSTLFFGAGDAVNGNELWKTDGTSAGTGIVKNIAPGAAHSSPQNFAALGSVLLFHAITTTVGTALWQSDGTDAGTTMVKDLDPSTTSGALSGPMTVANSKVFFEFNSVAEGREPWVSDGTSAGTFLLKDIYPGSSASFPEQFTAVGTKVYFTAQDATNSQLWTTDGTTANTVPFFDLVSGSKNDRYSYLYDANGTFYFSATPNYVGTTTEPFVSNGTTAGTTMLKDIVPGTGGSDARGYQYLNGTVYFIARTPATGYELWKTDGTEGNTMMVTEIYTGTTAGIGGTSTINGVVNNKIIFSGVDSIHNAEPFVSDGSAAGTILLKNIQTTGLGSYPLNITPIGNRLYFGATLGFSNNEPWYSDGTEAGTQMLKEIGAGAAYSNPYDFVNIDNTSFYFKTYNGSIASIYRSDGTDAGTIQIVNDVLSEPMVLVNNILFFVKRDANGTELWRYQSGAAALVKNINSGSANSFPGKLTAFNNQLYFFATNGTNGIELWKSDGTDAGTTMVADVNPGTGGLFTDALIVHGGHLYFFGNNGTSNALIKSDGTAAGTTTVKTFTNDDEFGNFFSFGNDLFFVKKNENASGQVNAEFWKTDGTGPGTILLKQIIPYTTDVSADYLHAISFFRNGNLFYFYADVENTFEETTRISFWRSDGTVAGTTELKSYTFTDDVEFENDLKYIARYDNNNVLFVFADGANGTEIWKSDGTVGGTNLSVQMVPGAEGGTPGQLLNFGDAIYFSSAGNNDFNELWKIATPAVLPLNLISFTADNNRCAANLKWTTATEQNTKQFEVQHSPDGITFTTIGVVPSVGNSNAEKHYSYSSNLVNESNYFRLQMFDRDGSSKFSAVVSVTANCSSNAVTVYPNPAKNIITVSGLSGANQLRLLDHLGRVVNTIKTSNRSATIDLYNLPAGNYIIQVVKNNVIENIKVIKE